MERSSQTEFCGKVAVVTGAAQGIGKSISEMLAEQGARVIALDRKFTQELSSNQPREGSENIILQNLDVSDSSACRQCFENIVRDFGVIHYVVHAAAILKTGEIINSCVEDWEEILRVNIMGSFNILSESARRMKQQREGAIVLVGSNASSTPRIKMGAYSASKAASTMMAKCLALELAEHGVRCNVVAPGSTDTAMQHQLWQSKDDRNSVIDGDLRSYRLGIPLRRIAEPQQIAKVALFLLSEQSSHITMEVIRADGGATLGSI